MRKLDYSVCVCGDDEDAKRIVMDLVASVSKLVPLDAGPLACAATIESITPLVITLAMRKRPEGCRGVLPLKQHPFSSVFRVSIKFPADMCSMISL